MTNFDNMVYKYTIKKSNKIKQICEPLSIHFGVNHFFFSKTMENGRYFSIASNPEMHEFYHSTKMHLYSPFFRKPELIEPGVYNYRNIKNQKFLNTIEMVFKTVNVNLGVVFVIKSGEDLIRFGYAVSPNMPHDAVDLVLNHYVILTKFNQFFLQKIEDILKNAFDDFVDLPTEMGKAYLQPLKGISITPSFDKNCALLESIGLLKKPDMVKLSLREIECLHLLHQGMSARQIGSMLRISTRTVETHLASLKNKLSCFSKADLFQKANLLQAAGIFERHGIT